MLNIHDLCASFQVGDSVNPTIRQLESSMILGIAAQVHRLQAEGKEVCNLTVGDFRPEHFPIPEFFAEEVQRAYKDGQTNYPPSDGVLELREAINELYERAFGVSYGVEGVCVASGARPPLYSSYQMFLQPGESSVSFLPSWNNRYYSHLRGVHHRFVPTTAESNFHPTVQQIKEIVSEVNLIALNSPLNPTGTMIGKEVLQGIAEVVVEENRRRGRNRRPVMIMFDQVYWMLVQKGQQHYTPVSLVPEVAPYVVHIDAISKAFAATGLRVGWAVLPPYLQPKMKALIGHTGAWAAKPEQIATARLLRQPELVDEYIDAMNTRVSQRLQFLYRGIMDMRKRGLPVNAVAPQGAIYLSFHVDLIGEKYKTNEAIRSLLLMEAGVAVVPFQAFDMKEENGWFRMSVGSCSMDDLSRALERIETLLNGL